MFKKFASFMTLVLVLAPVTNVLAAITWDAGGSDYKWDTDANWSGDTEPGAADTVYLYGPDDSITEVYKDSAACNVITNGDATNRLDHHLIIKENGVLTVGNYFANSCGVNAATGEITIESGGALYVCTNYFNLTHPNGNPANTEEANLGILNMDGGLLDIKTDFNVSRAANGNHRGEVYLYGGEIYANGIYMDFHSYEDPQEVDRWTANTTPDQIDITNGVMYIKGAEKTKIDGYVDNGWITAFGGTGIVHVQEEVSVTCDPQAGNGAYTKVWATPIPEPGTMLLAGFGVLVLLVSRRKR